MEQANLKDRTVYFDYLRVFAAFAVIIIHTAAQNWYSVDVNSFEWQVLNFYDAIVRWGVPVFVMISGSLFLGKEIPLKKIYAKYILRMAISFIVWSVVYTVFHRRDIVNSLLAIISGQWNYHMWFVLMIIGIYMCIPIIKPIVETNVKIKYYLLLSFVFAFVVPEVTVLTNDFGNELIVKFVNTINNDVNTMRMHLVLGYAGYFVLGYYINKTDLNKRLRMIIYALGILGFIFTIVTSLIVSLQTQAACATYYGEFTINVLCESVAVFTWFKYRKYNLHKLNLFIRKLSKYSFGAYLVHLLVLEQLYVRFGLNALSYNPVFAVIYIGVLVFVISFALSAILNRIPVVKKYVV